MQPIVEPLPTAAQTHGYVLDFVRQINARVGLPLDYSVKSLRVVDRVVDGLRRGGGDRARPAETLFGLGAYAGEVLVRRAGGFWVDLSTEQRELFGQPLAVRMPDGRSWNPIGKVVKRFEYGAEESVALLYLQLHGRRRSGGPTHPGGGPVRPPGPPR
ncbi:hypothetical protein ABZ714_21470 [Streptomyces sp. NPDC006798]|uniref:hypothetical protein n=1 Tax=Streptomyces sp. NPDC006798 TaxID=3155462 RepID=UPI0033EB3FC3